MSISEKVCEVIEQHTGQKVTESTSLESLNLDSLETLDLLLTIEKETGLKVPDERIGDLQTVGDIARMAGCSASK